MLTAAEYNPNAEVKQPACDKSVPRSFAMQSGVAIYKLSHYYQFYRAAISRCSFGLTIHSVVLLKRYVQKTLPLLLKLNHKSTKYICMYIRLNETSASFVYQLRKIRQSDGIHVNNYGIIREEELVSYQ